VPQRNASINGRQNLTLGVVLAIIGAFFVLRRSIPLAGPGPTLLLLGAIFLAVSALRSFRGPLLPGSVLLGLGCGFLLQDPLEPWLPRWATLLAGLGAGFLLVAGLDRAAGRGRTGPWLVPAAILLGIAVGAAIARRVNVTVFFGKLATLAPWLIVGAGLWLVLTALRRRKV
jgi:hypothetical protein